MHEDEFGDTAGAIPSNGVVVRGLRTYVVTRPRELTPASAVRAVFWRFVSTDWYDVIVEEAGSGAPIAEARFTSVLRARAARRRFVEAVGAMSDADMAQADWARVLAEAARLD